MTETIGTCEMCSEPAPLPMERMAVEGKNIQVGECCFWHMYHD